MDKDYILVIDQGTTSSRVVLIDNHGEVKYKEQMAINVYEYDNGAIRQNALEILDSVVLLINRIIKINNINEQNIKAIGITNQRETVVMWDKTSGKPLDDAISWQSKETQNITNELIKQGYNDLFKTHTGLTISPYFSASKIMYLLAKHHYPTNICVGTIDSFLLYNLSQEHNHYTDYTNASRTMLFNIIEKKWDQKILDLLKIPLAILPKALPSNSHFGTYLLNKTAIPILAMVGDQQASLFGHQCFNKGQVKATYGTGAFILLNTGEKAYFSQKGLLTTIGISLDNRVYYALEGSLFVCGAALEWLREDLNLFNDPQELETIISKASDEEIYFIPAFFGLGTPYWDNEVRASFLGLKRKTSKEDLIKAVLKAITFQVTDVLNVLSIETKLPLSELSTDGGVSKCEYILQQQANIANLKVIQSSEHEITALGAGYIAGLKAGFWRNFDELGYNKHIKKLFYPRYDANTQQTLYKNWQTAINATQAFRIRKVQ